jgi:hypothetical protein
MVEWINENKTLLWLLSAASIVVLIASIFLIPMVVSRIRPDYFAHDKRPDRSWINLHPTVRIAIHIGKNILGAILMVAGLAMLALPGPGMITLLVGFFLLDFPGKYRFERWLVARPVIHRPINWLRRRAGRLPLVIFSKSAPSHEIPSRQH